MGPGWDKQCFINQCSTLLSASWRNVYVGLCLAFEASLKDPYGAVPYSTLRTSVP